MDRPLCDESVPTQIATLVERIRGIGERMDRSERERDERVRLALEVLEHRLMVLNDAHAEARRVHDDTIRALSTYLTKESYEAQNKTVGNVLEHIKEEIATYRGMAYWPMIMATGALLAGGAALLKTMMKG